MKRLRVLVVEDEGLYREMLLLALQSVPELEVAGAAAGPGAALAAARELRPDVLLLDIDLGAAQTGIDVGLAVRREQPQVGVVLLSNYVARQYLQALPQEAAYGWSYLLKRSIADLATLVRAIQGAAMGLMVLDPRLNRELAARPGSRLDRLTPRQLEVLRLVAEGHSNAAIAGKLFLSEKSVENYLTAIYQQLDVWQGQETVHPRVRAVLIYLQESRLIHGPTAPSAGTPESYARG